MLTSDPIPGSSVVEANHQANESHQGVERIIELAAGRYDALNGRYLTAYDDLPAMEHTERHRYTQALNDWILKFNDST